MSTPNGHGGTLTVRKWSKKSLVSFISAACLIGTGTGLVAAAGTAAATPTSPSLTATRACDPPDNAGNPGQYMTVTITNLPTVAGTPYFVTTPTGSYNGPDFTATSTSTTTTTHIGPLTGFGGLPLTATTLDLQVRNDAIGGVVYEDAHVAINALDCSKVTAALTVTPNSGNTPLKVTADASASTNATSYSFAWGDGSSLTGFQSSPTATHTYSKVGNYTVTVTAKNDGGSDTASKTVEVTTVAPTCTQLKKGDLSITSDKKGNITVTPKKDVCDQSLAWQLYQAPSTWDGKGFDASASPQNRVDVDTETVSGTSATSLSVSFAKLTPSLVDGVCKAAAQLDLQNAPGQTTVTWPSGSSQPLYYYEGVLWVPFPMSDCNPTPPQAGAPGLSASAGSCSASNGSTGSLNWMAVNPKDGAGTDHDTVVTLRDNTVVKEQTVDVADGQSASGSVTGLAAGTYTVFVHASNGEESSPVQVTVGTCSPVTPPPVLVINATATITFACAENGFANVGITVDSTGSTESFGAEALVNGVQKASHTMTGDVWKTTLTRVPDGATIVVNAADLQRKIIHVTGCTEAPGPVITPPASHPTPVGPVPQTDGGKLNATATAATTSSYTGLGWLLVVIGIVVGTLGALRFIWRRRMN